MQKIIPTFSKEYLIKMKKRKQLSLQRLQNICNDNFKPEFAQQGIY